MNYTYTMVLRLKHGTLTIGGIVKAKNHGGAMIAAIHDNRKEIAYNPMKVTITVKPPNKVR